VTIPANVESIGDLCFSACVALVNVRFENGSKLSKISVRSFQRCSALAEIRIPAGVEMIPGYCFSYCCSLRECAFEAGSRIMKIEPGAFAECLSLMAIEVPGMLEAIEQGAFRDCKSLVDVRFHTPARIRQLDLPPSMFGSLCIPDSVEMVSGLIGKQGGQSRIVSFGAKSRLRVLRFNQCTLIWVNTPRDTAGNLFVRLPESILKRFRRKFEVR
jgi:hypothetical protein